MATYASITRQGGTPRNNPSEDLLKRIRDLCGDFLGVPPVTASKKAIDKLYGNADVAKNWLEEGIEQAIKNPKARALQPLMEIAYSLLVDQRMLHRRNNLMHPPTSAAGLSTLLSQVKKFQLTGVYDDEEVTNIDRVQRLVELYRIVPPTPNASLSVQATAPANANEALEQLPLSTQGCTRHCARLQLAIFIHAFIHEMAKRQSIPVMDQNNGSKERDLLRILEDVQEKPAYSNSRWELDDLHHFMFGSGSYNGFRHLRNSIVHPQNLQQYEEGIMIMWHGFQHLKIVEKNHPAAQLLEGIQNMLKTEDKDIPRLAFVRNKAANQQEQSRAGSGRNSRGGPPSSNWQSNSQQPFSGGSGGNGRGGPPLNHWQSSNSSAGSGGYGRGGPPSSSWQSNSQQPFSGGSGGNGRGGPPPNDWQSSKQYGYGPQ